MDKEMKALSYDYRMDTVRMIMSGGGGHIGMTWRMRSRDSPISGKSFSDIRTM